MTGQNRRRRRAAAFFLSGLLCASLAGPPAQAAALEADCLVPVGHTIGIKLFAEGVVVIGLAEVDGQTVSLVERASVVDLIEAVHAIVLH